MASVKCQPLPPQTHVAHRKTHRKLLKPGSRIWVTTLTSLFRNACKHTHAQPSHTLTQLSTTRWGKMWKRDQDSCKHDYEIGALLVYKKRKRLPQRPFLCSSHLLSILTLPLYCCLTCFCFYFVIMIFFICFSRSCLFKGLFLSKLLHHVPMSHQTHWITVTRPWI